MQRPMLIALVATEVVLVMVATLVLYLDLNEVLEQQLYRVHHADNRDVLGTLLPRLGKVVAGLFVANATILVVAEGFWARSVQRVLDEFVALSERTAALDFAGDHSHDGYHEAIDTLCRLRHYERNRLQGIRSAVSRLAGGSDAVEGMDREELRSCLERVRLLLRDLRA